MSRSRCRRLGKKKPGSFLPGGLLEGSQTTGSEVTLNAEVEGQGVLRLERQGRWRVRSTRVEGRRAGETRREVGPDGFRRERQVLDRSPPGDATKHRDGVVRVAAVSTGVGNRQSVGLAVFRPGSVVIANPTHAAEQAARPVRIPVVVERAADAIC